MPSESTKRMDLLVSSLTLNQTDWQWTRSEYSTPCKKQIQSNEVLSVFSHKKKGCFEFVTIPVLVFFSYAATSSKYPFKYPYKTVHPEDKIFSSLTWGGG